MREQCLNRAQSLIDFVRLHCVSLKLINFILERQFVQR
jgi:hypothetical protein